jgi:hypothetical protein
MFLAVILGNFEDARDKINFAHIATKAFISRLTKKKKLAGNVLSHKSRGISC